MNKLNKIVKKIENSGGKATAVCIDVTDDTSVKKLFESIKFKPNRLVGFVRTNTSYHSIPPRILPEGVTRDCFQINIWNYNRS